MKQIKIIAKTENGTKAIQKHIDESFKEGFAKKLMFKQLGFNQSVTSKDPLTLQLEVNNPRLRSIINPTHIIMVIAEALKENGAIKDKDYITEVD